MVNTRSHRVSTQRIKLKLHSAQPKASPNTQSPPDPATAAASVHPLTPMATMEYESGEEAALQLGGEDKASSAISISDDSDAARTSGGSGDGSNEDSDVANESPHDPEVEKVISPPPKPLNVAKKGAKKGTEKVTKKGRSTLKSASKAFNSKVTKRRPASS